MWHELNSEQAVNEFLQSIAHFHDSCLKSFSYVSGAYVDSELSMHPLNDKRTLNMVFQRQFEEFTTFELEFYGLEQLNYAPADTSWSCEIDSAKLYIKDGLIWLEHPSTRLLEANVGPVMNLVCAAGCRWRSVE